MIKIAIVEDEEMYAEQLKTYLHQYEKENGEVFDITYCTVMTLYIIISHSMTSF